MLHRDDAAAARNTIEPPDFVIESDDDPEQEEDASRPKLAELHRHWSRRDQKRQSDRAGDRRPGEEGEVKSERSRPDHRPISASADSTVGTERSRSTMGRSKAPRYLPYSLASSST